MSVLVEAISVIVRNESLEARFPGGVAGYRHSVPNQTFCTDGSITRVGFMDPADARHWLESSLATHDLGIDVSTRLSETTVIVDQMTGPTGPCDWIAVADHDDGYRFCWLADGDPGPLAAPIGWTPENSQSMTKWTTNAQGSPVSTGANRDGDGFGFGQTTRVFDTEDTDRSARSDMSPEGSVERSGDGSVVYSPEKGLGIRAGTSLLEAARFVVRASDEDPGGEMTADGAYLIDMAMLYGNREGATAAWALNRRKDWATRLPDRETCIEFADYLARRTSGAKDIAEIQNCRDTMSEAGHFLNAYSKELVEDGTFAAMTERLSDAEAVLFLTGPLEGNFLDELASQEMSRRRTLAAEIGLPSPPVPPQRDPIEDAPAQRGASSTAGRCASLRAVHVVVAQMGMVGGQPVHMNSLEGRDVTISVEGTRLAIAGGGLAESYDLESVLHVELSPDGMRLGIAAPGLVAGLLIPEPGTHVVRVDAHRQRSPSRSELGAFHDAVVDAVRSAGGSA